MLPNHPGHQLHADINALGGQKGSNQRIAQNRPPPVQRSSNNGVSKRPQNSVVRRIGTEKIKNGVARVNPPKLNAARAALPGSIQRPVRPEPRRAGVSQMRGSPQSGAAERHPGPRAGSQAAPEQARREQHGVSGNEQFGRSFAPTVCTPLVDTPSSKQEYFRVGKSSYLAGPLIGKGGYSEVFRVTDEKSKRDYALKIVRLGSRLSNNERENLLKEVQTLESLKNVSHVIQLVQADLTDPSTIKVLMELGEGDLSLILQSLRETSEPTDFEFIRLWGGQVLRAVNAIHNLGIVHSDLKPANFVVKAGSLKLIDFGIANPVPQDTASIHRTVPVGTLAYMAPETFSAKNDIYRVTFPSDMWSVGVILFEMVYQTRPYPAQNYVFKCMNELLEPPMHLTTTKRGQPIPQAIHEVVAACLCIDPIKRITASQAARSLFFHPISVDSDAVYDIVCRTQNRVIKLFEQGGIEMARSDLRSLSDYMLDVIAKFNNSNKYF